MFPLTVGLLVAEARSVAHDQQNSAGSLVRLCILVPPPPVRANSFRVRFARPAGFHLVIDRALPPVRADSADIRDNLVIDRLERGLTRFSCSLCPTRGLPPRDRSRTAAREGRQRRHQGQPRNRPPRARANSFFVFALPDPRASTSSSIAHCRPRGPTAPTSGTTS